MKRRVMFAGVAAIAGLLVPLAAATPPGQAPAPGWAAWARTARSASGSSSTSEDPPTQKVAEPTRSRSMSRRRRACGTRSATRPPAASTSSASSAPSPSRTRCSTSTSPCSRPRSCWPTRQPGTWYELPVNPNAGAAGAAECAKLPLFAFEPPDVPPPMPNVPPVDLADYAYNNMRVPSPGVQLMPGTRGWVNLATYVHLTRLHTTFVTASLGDQAVTGDRRADQAEDHQQLGRPGLLPGLQSDRLEVSGRSPADRRSRRAAGLRRAVAGPDDRRDRHRDRHLDHHLARH